MSQQARDTDWPGWVPCPPAPFSAVDELSCYYDVAAEPNTVHLEVSLPGQLDYPRLRQAVARSLAEQPRARASRAPGGPLRRGYTWQYPRQPDVDPVWRLTWAGQTQLARSRQAFLAAAPPLDSSPPLRLLLAAGPAGDCLILNAHHAALDGLSCLRLLRRISEHYRQAGQDGGGRDEDAAPASRPAPALASRGSSAGAGWPASADGPRLLPRWLPARIAAEPGDGRASRDGCGLHVLTLPDLPAMSSLHATPAIAPGRRVTVNDVLIAAAIAAIGRWNDARRRPARQVRITMPLSARPAGQENAIGNLSRIATISAYPPPRGADLSRLLLQVARQTSAAKESAGPQLGAGSRWLAAAPLPAAVKRHAVRVLLRTIGPVWCDTSMVTNLGNVADPPRFGLAGPVRMAFSSSAHMPRGLSIGAIAADGQLQLTLRYRYALFGDAAAAAFAAGYLTALRELGGLKPDGGGEGSR